MKKVVTSVFNTIGFIGSFFIPLIIPKLWTTCINQMRSGYLKGKLKSCGSNFRVNFPFYHVGLNHISVGNNFRAFSGLRIEAYDTHIGYGFSPELTIGDNVSINQNCHIACCHKIIIGNNVLMASNIFMTDHFHGVADAQSIELPPAERKLVSKGPIIIEENVWIGEGVAIMPGVTIGANCILGANAVVTKSFPANAVIGGNPAKIIKMII
jgi:serine acetyltransferase